MKIAIIVSTFPPYKGGMGNVAEEEARLLSEKGHEVTVIIPKHASLVTVTNRANSDSHQFRIIEVEPFFSFGNAAFIPSIRSIIHNFDVVHLHYPFFGGAEWLAWKKWRNPDFKYVVTYHMDNIGRGWLAMIFKMYARVIMPKVLRRAESIAVSSRDYAETSPVLKRVWPYIEHKVVEIPFCIPRSWSDTSQTPDSKLQTQSFTLIAGLDQAHYFKGVDVLLRAFAAAQSQLSGYELRIVGDGDMRTSYEKLAQELGIAEKVKFLGAVPNGDELKKLVAESRALILPSIDRSEAFGLVLLQALAVGTPLIAANLPGVRTVATDDVAIRVAPGNVTALAVALRMMANDETLYEKMKKSIPKKLEKYQAEAYTEALEKLLEVDNKAPNPTRKPRTENRPPKV